MGGIDPPRHRGELVRVAVEELKLAGFCVDAGACWPCLAVSLGLAVEGMQVGVLGRQIGQPRGAHSNRAVASNCHNQGSLWYPRAVQIGSPSLPVKCYECCNQQ